MKLDPNNAATIAGGSAGLAMILSVDYERLGRGDKGQLALLVAGLLIMALGYFTNRQPPPPAVPAGKE